MALKDIININLIGSVGGLDNLFITLLIFVALDYLTGVIKAIYKKKLNSKLGLKGILKKLGYIVIVVVATLFDYLIGDNTMAVRSLVIYFFISNEAISILENWAMMGLPLPNKIFQVFENLKDNDKKSWLDRQKELIYTAK